MKFLKYGDKWYNMVYVNILSHYEIIKMVNDEIILDLRLKKKRLVTLAKLLENIHVFKNLVKNETEMRMSWQSR